MNGKRILRLAGLGLCTLLAICATISFGDSGPTPATPAAPAWPQWGGPTGDFQIPATGLADAWSAEVPKRLWSRALGEGYAAIAADARKLYTMCRQGNEELVVALYADNG